MFNRPYILAETTWETTKGNDYEVAILPWGATEAHNYHLPYSTDVIQCDYIAAESARLAWEKKSKVIVLPTVPFGVNTGQLDIKFDINMNPSTQAAVLCDIVDSLSRQGMSKVVVMNGHGGNDFKQMIREIQPNYSHMLISTLSWYQVINTAICHHPHISFSGCFDATDRSIQYPVSTTFRQADHCRTLYRL